MTRQDYLRTSFFLALTDQFPPLVKDAILSDDEVTGKFALTSDGILTFGPKSTAFLRSKIFSVIRDALAAGGEAQSVTDQAGAAWTVQYQAEPTPHISMRSEAGIFTGSHLVLLAEDPSIRLAAFNAEVRRVDLPAEAAERWSVVLQSRALTDDEMGDFVADINMTPVVVSSAIGEHLARANVSIEVLVPKSPEYYERLVGQETGQKDIQAYVHEVLGEHMGALLRWNNIEGFRHCLLLGAHSLVAHKLSTLEIDQESVEGLAEWIFEHGDPISKGLFLEVSILKGITGDAVTAKLASIAQSLGAESEGEDLTPYAILSATFVAVYGELAQARLLVSKPIYWRRLAAMAQASLIVRHVVASQLNLSGFVGWLRELRGNLYLAQVYADLREAPLWQPQFALPYQLRNEIAGRVVVQAGNAPQVVQDMGLTECLISDSPESLKSKINLMLAQMSGPLEGDIRLIREIPPEEYPKVRDPLGDKDVNALSFAPLVNSALLFVVPTELADLAAEALQRSQFQIDSGGDSGSFIACLVGLATVAGITRSLPLADAVFATIRYHRRYTPTRLSVDEALRAGMMACGSRTELGDWCAAVGRLTSNLAFGEISEQEAAGLHAFILNLCGIIPEMWASCGPGLAALEAVAA